MKKESPKFKIALHFYYKHIVAICLIGMFYSCKEKNNLPEEITQLEYTETHDVNTQAFNLVGKWKMDSIWTLKDDKKIKPRIGLIDISWTFDENNNWQLESGPVNAKIENNEVELSNPMNKLKSKYTVTDSILTLRSLDLKYKILEIDSTKIYMKSLGVINEAYKFVSVTP
ncbi:hypothetical protein [Maribacter luteus]|uniref:Lipocalin-like domain-containing protein n=1 Tax=Maribacter luteus TaxID=2594478 RepID=A0A6I2MQB4_9FLAO|nr:hypothetical protein [Maribacter luteus]MRX64715.1 hypothetical protein [Maribacter luteus]